MSAGEVTTGSTPPASPAVEAPSRAVVDSAAARGPAGGHSCEAREVLNRVGDKWSVYVIAMLGEGTRRFTELRNSIDGISQRMLTVTLRGLERDGIITRTIHPVIPPRVDYALTPLGASLLETVATLARWSETHACDIQRARAAYDSERATEPSDQPETGR